MEYRRPTSPWTAGQHLIQANVQYRPTSQSQPTALKHASDAAPEIRTNKGRLLAEENARKEQPVLPRGL
jgi:hypothetical protein